MDIAALISKYGFPIVAAVGLGYFVYYIWVWATKEVQPILDEAQVTLIALIDRIRMLDNDLIRLNQKLNTVLQLRGKKVEDERMHFQELIDTAEEVIEEVKQEDQPKRFRYKKKD
jgi:hypothetical protein